MLGLDVTIQIRDRTSSTHMVHLHQTLNPQNEMVTSSILSLRSMYLTNPFEVLFERIIQSARMVSISEVEFDVIATATSLRTLDIEGGVAIKLPAWTKKFKRFKESWEEQEYRGEKINCLAFAISSLIYPKSGNLNTTVTIKRKALDLMKELNWGHVVHFVELKNFINRYPTFRVTIINTEALGSFRDTTVAGDEYQLEFNNQFLTSECQKKTLYIIYLAGNPGHYAAVQSPAKFYEVVGKRSLWCHACISAYREGRGCNCLNPMPSKKPKIYEKIKECKHCGKVKCDPGNCVRNCSFCGSQFKYGYGVGQGHRCIIAPTKDIKKLVFMQPGEEEGAKARDTPYKLWAYDLESCIKIVEGTMDRFCTENGEFTFEDDKVKIARVEKGFLILTRGTHEVNLVCFMDVFSGQEYFYEGEGCLYKFCEFMMNTNHGKNIAIAHNGAGYDSRLIFNQISKMARQQVRATTRGTKFMELKCGTELVTIFRDSLLHLPGSLSKLAKEFNLPIRKGLFPHLFNSEENYGYEGQLPCLSYFDLSFHAKTEKDVLEIKEWHAQRSLDPWNFRNELISYCKDDVRILAQLIKILHEVCMDFAKISPWFFTTAPSFVHEVVKQHACSDEALGLPDKEDVERRRYKVDQVAEKEGWAVLEPVEYFFARKALRGGRTDIRQLYCKLTEEEKARGCQIRYQDVVSMYPYVQVAFPYPVGIPRISVYDEDFYPCSYHQNPHKGNDLMDNCSCSLSLKKNKISSKLVIEDKIGTQPSLNYLLSDDCFGIICISLEPPKNLYHPVLVQRDPDSEKCVASLEKISFGTFTTEEVKEAIRQGYEVIKVHRIDVYHRKEGLWNDLVKRLYVEKLANSKPAPINQQAIIDEYETRFGMGEMIKQSFPRWQKNPAWKMVMKIMLNSMWGKHCQRPNMPETLVIGEDDPGARFDLFANLENGNLLLSSIQECNETTVYTTTNTGKTNPNLHGGYLPAGVFVPMWGRLLLLKQLTKLGKRVLYHDTDSIIYKYDPLLENINESSMWGEWEEEDISKNGKITEFVGLGPKSYGLKTEDSAFVKIKGLSLKYSHRDIINFDKLVGLILDHKENRYPVIDVPQMTFKYSLGKEMQTIHFLKQINFQPEVLKGKLVGLNTYPFGYVI